jgi:predicted RNase H-like nuclease (RuvC/YqgF family)
MVQKVGELSWFERMTKEFENDPEYLREYIMLCSSQIKDQETKIAALEQRFDALSTKFSAMVEENATLRKRLDNIFAIGHNDDCLFCGLKDREAIMALKDES